MLEQSYETEKRGRPQGVSLFGKASLVCQETVIKYRSVSDIAALQVVGSEMYRRQRHQFC